MILCWAAKGGSGATVVACAIALGMPGNQPVTLVDLAGDCATALGLAESSAPGVVDWLASTTAGPAELERLATPVRDDVRLIGPGSSTPPADQWDRLAEALNGWDNVIVDAGTGPPPDGLQAQAKHSLLVIRPCYLALRRARHIGVQPSGVVLVGEPGRALTSSDVEHALGVPVVADVRWDPAVARAVDSGLLIARLPRSLAQSLRSAA